MSSEETFDLDRAYAVVTPEDNRRLYADWAATYDEGFVATHGYVYHRSVVTAFLGRTRPTGAVLDVGCGTGVVGEELARWGVAEVDGIDLSPEMLDVAGTKRTEDGRRVYRQLIAADLTVDVDMNDGSYAGVVSAGAFTHGHLGPEPLAELIRIAAPGAVLAIGINADHFESAGFSSWFDEATSAGTITSLEVVESPVYDPDRYAADDAAAHASTNSSIAVFERSGPG
jgi:2-polyprenyl-3-methyl-5-hydroxy-6-metoxy-1,4-benzoquinol methylase